MLPVTSTPMRMRLVSAACAASAVHASRMGPVGSPLDGVLARWSEFQIWSNPASTASGRPFQDVDGDDLLMATPRRGVLPARAHVVHRLVRRVEHLARHLRG